MRRIGMLLLGLTLGALVAWALAQLFAPRSGDELRQDAREYYDELLAEARQAAAERRQSLAMELHELTGTTGAPSA
ncbi:MAG: YtxH domain-containing protein [Anaerolineae bacterium]|nr:YtxH domain-containing protein [Anaerolineae bacterium]